MSAIETFGFGKGYTLRPAGMARNDFYLAKLWTLEDPYHRTMDPAFWTEQVYGVDCYLLSDADGPLLFLRLEAKEGACTVHVQFKPSATAADRERLREALRKGWPWLEQLLRQAHFSLVFFDSVSKSLVTFCERELGFKAEGERLSKMLGVEASAQTA